MKVAAIESNPEDKVDDRLSDRMLEIAEEISEQGLILERLADRVAAELLLPETLRDFETKDLLAEIKRRAKSEADTNLIATYVDWLVELEELVEAIEEDEGLTSDQWEFQVRSAAQAVKPIIAEARGKHARKND